MNKSASQSCTNAQVAAHNSADAADQEHDLQQSGISTADDPFVPEVVHDVKDTKLKKRKLKNKSVS